MNNTLIDKIITIIINLIYIYIGILFLIIPNTTLNSFKILGIIIIITSLIKFLLTILLKKKKQLKLIKTTLTLIIGLLLILFPYKILIISSKIYGTYTFFQGIIDLINLIIYKDEKTKEKIFIFIKFITNIIFSYLLIIINNNHIYISFILVIYLIFQGICELLILINHKISIKIAAPLLFTWLLPRQLIKKVNQENIDYNDCHPNDLEISIHMAKKGSAALGHGELSFENKIYSYGCYNYHNRKLFGLIGDGILGIFDHDSYIKYCIEDKNRFILSYGFKLNDKEKRKLRKKIQNILKNCNEWFPDSHYKKKHIPKMPDDIYYKANGKFYKFIDGPFKTFFLLRTNCVSVCNMFLESSKMIKLLKIDGIISPGTYYNYLENMYKKKENNIVSKILYNKDKTKKFKYKEKN